MLNHTQAFEAVKNALLDPEYGAISDLSEVSAVGHRVVQGTTSTTQYVVVTTDEVRASGLLKDRIVISYPEENTGNKDMAVLQAAADEWKDKWDHWYQYCYEQHYAYVNPILVY